MKLTTDESCALYSLYTGYTREKQHGERWRDWHELGLITLEGLKGLKEKGLVDEKPKNQDLSLWRISEAGLAHVSQKDAQAPQEPADDPTHAPEEGSEEVALSLEEWATLTALQDAYVRDHKAMQGIIYRGRIAILGSSIASVYVLDRLVSLGLAEKSPRGGFRISNSGISAYRKRTRPSEEAPTAQGILKRSVLKQLKANEVAFGTGTYSSSAEALSVSEEDMEPLEAQGLVTSVVVREGAATMRIYALTEEGRNPQSENSESQMTALKRLSDKATERGVPFPRVWGTRIGLGLNEEEAADLIERGLITEGVLLWSPTGSVETRAFKLSSEGRQKAQEA